MTAVIMMIMFLWINPHHLKIESYLAPIRRQKNEFHWKLMLKRWIVLLSNLLVWWKMYQLNFEKFDLHCRYLK